MEIHFTKHAREKFAVLARHGVRISGPLSTRAEKHSMQKRDIKISYDPEADVLSWEVSRRGIIDSASEMGNIVVHFTKKNLPVLIEVLEASRLFRKSERMIERTHVPAALAAA
jgi:hypothetical protein